MLRKSFVLPVLALILLAGCRTGNDALEKQNAETLSELKRLNARLDVVEKQSKQNAEILAEMKKINANLDRLEKQMKQIQINRATPPVFGPTPAIRNKLSKIRPLPANPTDQQIIDYIRQIRQASNGQTVFSFNDPQVRMYEQIGPGHLHLLLPYFTGNGGMQQPSSFHLRVALPKLVGEADKELVRRSLKQYPILISGVVRNGWIKEMKQEIIAMLKMPDVSRLFELRKCIRELGQSPDVLKVLTDIYINDPNGYFFWAGLKQIPGVDIRDLVARAWKKALEDPPHASAMISRAQQVIQDGGPNVEAVKYLLKVLMTDPPEKLNFQMRPNVSFLSSRCDFPIYDPARSREYDPVRLREWYDKNADRIVYDPAKGKYVIKSGENLQKLLTSLGVPDCLKQAKCDSDALAYQAGLWDRKKRGFESGVIPLTDVLSEELRFIDILRKSQNLSESVKTQLIKEYSKRLDKIYSLKKAEFEAGILSSEEWTKWQKTVSDLKKANNIK